jgi:SHS2 domain-containing protein
MAGKSHLVKLAGSTLAEIFQTAAQRLSETLFDTGLVQPTLREKISIDADTLDDLMLAWLTSLLNLFKNENILTNEVHIKSLDAMEGRGFVLKAEVLGDLWDAHRHTLKQKPSQVSFKTVQVSGEGGSYKASFEVLVAD